MQSVKVQSKSGEIIELFIRQPNSTVKGVVVINTGTCIPQKVYWNFAHFLSENGYVTITYDYSNAYNYLSNVSHVDWLKDMEATLAYVLKNYAQHKKVIIGHSSGGQLIGYMPNAQYFDKIYMVASAHAYWGKLPTWFGFLMQFFWRILVPINIFVYGYFNNKMYGVSGGFPKNIILELRSFCLNKDFFFPFFKSKNINSNFDTIKCNVKAYHLDDDLIANYTSCKDMLKKYVSANTSIETLKAKDFGIKKFGHRGFFSSKVKNTLWYYFLKDLES